MQRRYPRIIGGEECWLCPTCGRWMARRDYYARARSWNGIGNQCRKCHTEGNTRTRDRDNTARLNREHMARARENDPEKFRGRERIASRKRPRTQKTIARCALNLAVRRGEIVRPSRCTRCGEERRLHAHHPDYSRPLFVEWICTRCHGKEHRKE